MVTGEPVSADVGSSGVLTCSVSNNQMRATVNYQWKRAGKLLATSETSKVSLSVSASDAGVYTCVANVSDSGGSPVA